MEITTFHVHLVRRLPFSLCMVVLSLTISIQCGECACASILIVGNGMIKFQAVPEFQRKQLSTDNVRKNDPLFVV